MNSRPKYRKDKNQDNCNRLRIVMAVVFLLAGAILLRLFNLQIADYELYTALASDQHQVQSDLKPQRGRIFIQDSKELMGSEVYPLATNKDFGRLYAVPEDIKQPKQTAQKVYEILDKDKVVKEVKELLEKQGFATSTRKATLREYRARQEAKDKEVGSLSFREVKKELEIKARKEAIIRKYVEKFSKPGDPYEPLRRKVPEKTLKKLDGMDLEGVEYVMEKHRYYPEGEIGSHILGFVGYENNTRQGQYGLEGYFDEELSGEYGTIRAEKAATGNVIIVNDREYLAPQKGDDLVLTINRSIQFTACRKLKKAVKRHDAKGGDVVIMHPETGALLAMCSYPNYNPNKYNQVDSVNAYNNPAIFDAYEPGSIFKVFTMAAGLEEGEVTPKSTYRDKGKIKVEGWPKPIKNSDFDSHGPHGRVTMVDVLAKSLNTGSIHVMQQAGPEVFADYVKKFGFGQQTGIELETEGGSDIRNLERDPIRPVEAATASFGQGITATPLQITRAYAAIANGGVLMKPYLVGKIVGADGQARETQPQQIRRVISERTSMLLSGMMANVVDEGHAKQAGVKGYFVAGKTGTAQVASREKRGYSEDAAIHSFAGFAPVEEPEFVMLVRLNNPKGVEYSSGSAAPLFGDLAEFILNYYQVPKER